LTNPTQLETVACDLCGSTDSRPVMCVRDRMYDIPGEFQLVRCQKCGLLYLNPRPDFASIGRYYPDLDYHAFHAIAGLKAKLIKRLHDSEAKSLLDGLSPNAHTLEIGCGTGDLLHALREHGADVVGIEPNDAAAALARNQRGLDVRTGILDNVSLDPAQFDLVLMKYSLEHVHSPSATLTTIRDLLKPGGRAVFWVPNAASLDARLFGQYWRGLDAPRHLYIFTPETMRKLFETAELKLHRVGYSGVPNDWAGSFEFWLRDRGVPDRVARLFGVSNPLAMAAWLPVSMFAAAIGSAGRMRVEGMRK
jgi:SAM-dependent methyltransferase